MTSDGNLQVSDLALSGAFGDQTTLAPIPVQVPISEQTGPASNVATLYRQLARDLREGTHTVPDFVYALTRHALLDAIETSATTSRTITTHDNWRSHD